MDARLEIEVNGDGLTLFLPGCRRGRSSGYLELLYKIPHGIGVRDSAYGCAVAMPSTVNQQQALRLGSRLVESFAHGIRNEDVVFAVDEQYRHA